ncbi:MAG: type IV pili twitching motility protein PilT, partial [Nitrospirota bacterium]
MATLHELLQLIIEKGASDLHITTGTPPQLRIDGKLVPLDLPQMGPSETKSMCYSVLTDAQKHKFEENNELDLSFGIKGLSRFRANIFMQRGAV